MMNSTAVVAEMNGGTIVVEVTCAGVLAKLVPLF